jgi:hypothetical protein
LGHQRFSRGATIPVLLLLLPLHGPPCPALPCPGVAHALLREDIHVDEVALYSVSPSWMADRISKLVLELAGPDAVITDGTACVGGNVISFARCAP